jgi:SAM-dependent methyltransferase
MVRWWLTAGAQNAIGFLPRGDEVNYALKRRVLRTVPRSDERLLAKVEDAVQHVRAFERCTGRDLHSCHLYEFGAGADLVAPLCYRALGVRRQTVVDVASLAREELVVDAARRIDRLRPEIERLAGRSLAPLDVERVDGTRTLLNSLGITYLAPMDAAATGLPSESVDLVTSTEVLEHVPPGAIVGILRECARVLAPGGIASHLIDMQDHYAFGDEHLSVYNFLRYSERAWRLIDSPFEPQNRLRLRDHLELLDLGGWRVRDLHLERPTRDQRRELDSMRLAARFRNGYPRSGVAIRQAHVVAEPRTAHAVA